MRAIIRLLGMAGSAMMVVSLLIGINNGKLNLGDYDLVGLFALCCVLIMCIDYVVSAIEDWM